MALICFPSPAPSGYTDIESNGVGRYGLQQVKHVQPKQHRDVQLEPWIGRLDMHVELAPQVLPGKHMVRHHGIEATRARDRLARL